MAKGQQEHGDGTTRDSGQPGSDRFGYYVACLHREIEAAARVRWDDPEAFLWRCRRAAEALLHALRERAAPNSEHDPNATVDSLLNDNRIKPLIDRKDALPDFVGLQTRGNTGAHIQGGPLGYEQHARMAGEHLAAAVDWFYRGAASGFELPAAVREALDVIRDPIRRPPSPEDQLRDALARVARGEAEVRRAEAARDAAWRDARDLDAAAQALREENRRLHQRLAAEPPPRPPSAIPAVAWAALGVAALVLFLGGATTGVYATRPSTAARTSPRAVATAAALPSPSAATPESTPAAAPTPTPVALEAPTDAGAPIAPPPTCPRDTVEAPAWDLVLSPYPPDEREHWPPPLHPGRPRRVAVGRFCIQRRPVSVGAFLALGEDMVPAIRGCVWNRRETTAPMGCLTHDEARAWCGRWNPRGALPAVAQWEVLTRAVEARRAARVEPWSPADAGRYFEWVEDASPSEVFGLGAWSGPRGAMRRRPIPPRPYTGNRPRQSWHQPPSAARDDALYFRCVVPLDAPAGGAEPQ